MDWRMDTQGFLTWVSPFRNLRINGYLLLPEAFRSLSRLSSALSAKASALCPFCLTICFHHPSVGDAVVDSHCLINKFIDVFLSNVLRLYQGCLKNTFQTYMYAVFNVQSWLIFYQSFKEKISFLLKSLVKQPVSIFIRFPCFPFFDLAATCSPTSSPMQYHRPLWS